VSLVNFDGWIADWNVDRFLEGTAAGVDVEYLAELEEGGLPPLSRHARALAETYRQR
jgi:hypothetical protein